MAVTQRLPDLIRSLKRELSPRPANQQLLPSLRHAFSLHGRINLIDTVPEDQLRFQHLCFQNLGDSGVGKSRIVLRFVRGQFDPTSKVTIGASVLSQTVALQDSTTVKFEIWGHCWSREVCCPGPTLLSGCCGCSSGLYDITSPESFQKAQYWVKVGARGWQQLYFNAYFSVCLFLYSEFWWKLLEIDPQKPCRHDETLTGF